jgi:hypothetical protein
MNIAEAQRDIRLAYFSGATGALASGLAWLAAGVISHFTAPIFGVLALYVGGMFMFPVGVLIGKSIGCTGKHSPDNPLARLAIAGTIYMLLYYPVAMVVFLYNSAWFFPAMLLNVAGRYLVFQTFYGMRVYWLFSAALALGAIVLVLVQAVPTAGALAGGLIEIVFSIVLFLGHRRNTT